MADTTPNLNAVQDLLRLVKNGNNKSPLDLDFDGMEMLATMSLDPGLFGDDLLHFAAYALIANTLLNLDEAINKAKLVDVDSGVLKPMEDKGREVPPTWL